MGIFHEMVTVVNRTSLPLTARFDGQEITLEPGENIVPRITVPYIRSQCVIMGSEDARDPMSYTSLVGVKGKHDCSPIEQDDTQLTRVNRAEFEEDLGIKTKVRGKKKHSVHEARIGIAAFGEDMQYKA